MDENIIHFIQIYQRLPEHLGVEIFAFLVKDLWKGFCFKPLKPCEWSENTNYDKKYEMATFLHEYDKSYDKLVYMNGHYLAQIKKKNGNHRYYLSSVTIIETCNGCGSTKCRSRGCRGGYDVEKRYKSKFIGKSLNDAIFQLYFW